MADNTRDKIIEAATDLFSTKGFDNTSVKEIAEAADVNISAINYHFDSKENLLVTLIKNFGLLGNNIVKRMLQESKTKSEFRLRFTMFINTLSDAIYEHRRLVRIIDWEASRVPCRIIPVLESLYLPIVEVIIDYFEQGKKNKLIKPDIDSEDLTGIILSTTYQFAELFIKERKYFNYETSESRHKAIDTLMKVIFEGAVIA